MIKCIWLQLYFLKENFCKTILSVPKLFSEVCKANVCIEKLKPKVFFLFEQKVYTFKKKRLCFRVRVETRKNNELNVLLLKQNKRKTRILRRSLVTQKIISNTKIISIETNFASRKEFKCLGSKLLTIFIFLHLTKPLRKQNELKHFHWKETRGKEE